MKKLLLFAIIIFVVTVSKSQTPLTNTTWTVYDATNTFFFYFHFTADTVSYSNNNISYTNIATYQVSGNNFTITDLPTGPCLNDTGKYSYSIQNDTLKFVLVSDPCPTRSTTIGQYHWVQLLLGAPQLKLSTKFTMFPNPFTSQAILHSDILLHNTTLTIANISGQTIKEIKNISGQSVTLQRDNLPSGIYFIRLTQDNIIIATKKIVIAD